MPGDGMMGPGMMGPMMIFWAIVSIGLLALLIMGIIWAIRAVRGSSGRYHASESAKGSQEDAVLKILKERYARGEIDRKEYEERKRDLAA